MKGSKLFNLFNPLINFTSRVFKFFPRFIRTWLYDLSSIFSGFLAITLRYALIKSAAKKVGKNVYIGRGVVIKNSQNLSVGHNVSIHDSCYLDSIGEIKIGDNVSIAHHSSILSFNHSWTDTDKPIKYNELALSPVVIKDDVWVGCGVRIMPGVTVHSRSIIAAGSVVTRDVPAEVVVAGVPAKIIKRL
ncbi:acyltransferase [Thalassotalea litorea]|uniref:Acyltransferase n=1 Tax=Thalassotalea litorea TaxID=2020715 RepID=A0A5R9IM00_9GAMM|nr:acyltransferase [Thalassotalea litorea]TLU65097.1 acyltransferase [Thalassotalea litorea]